MKQIDDNLINRVERDFLPPNASFDTERRDFIRNLSSCDLLAVPGSGKTTALQAKIACLTKCSEDGDGILVISHTNTAVDEIKKKLQGKYGNIFEYPNSVCTVQEFVDTFLALPYYENRFRHRVEAIDPDRYEEELAYLLSVNYDKKIVYLRNKQYNFNAIRFGIRDNEVIIGEGIDCKNLKYNIPRTWYGHEAEYKKDVISIIFEAKKKILKKGILNYDDCYFLAEVYMKKHPKVIQYLQKRFHYIFIDETQDLESHQIILLDKIFNVPTCCLQRIGDINQSIYHYGAIALGDSVWNSRNEMYINNSLRLTKENADVVNSFTSVKGNDGRDNAQFVVRGIRVLPNPIPPYLILFDQATINNLESKFREIIEFHSLNRTIEGEKYGFHIIGWNGKKKDEQFNLDQMRLADIFPHYVKALSTNKSNFATLSEYLQCGNKENTLGSCRRSVLSAICKVLRIAKQKDIEGKCYTTDSLCETIAKNTTENNRFEIQLFNISKNMINGDLSSAYANLKNYIITILTNVLSFSITPEINIFLESTFSSFTPATEVNQAQQQYPVEISTVHHVKGMTHCGTMYVETFYYKYECDHLINEKGHTPLPSPYFQDSITITQVHAKQAMKMLYVGMSRPTHLLCYASLKQNWNAERLAKMKSVGWKLVDLTIPLPEIISVDTE